MILIEKIKAKVKGKNSSDPSKYSVGVGVHNVEKPDPWTKNNLKVAKIVIHQKYEKETLQNDIALIQLDVCIFKILIINSSFKIIK